MLTASRLWPGGRWIMDNKWRGWEWVFIPGSSRYVKFLPFGRFFLVKRHTFYTLGRSRYTRILPWRSFLKIVWKKNGWLASHLKRLKWWSYNHFPTNFARKSLLQRFLQRTAKTPEKGCWESDLLSFWALLAFFVKKWGEHQTTWRTHREFSTDLKVLWKWKSRGYVNICISNHMHANK